MVAGGEAYIFGAGVFYGFDPFVGIEVGRIEGCRCFGVFVGGDAVVEIPFALTEHGVYSPMDEYAKCVVGKFLPSLHDGL